MGKKDIEKSAQLGFRITDGLKNELLSINNEYSVPAREAIEQYIPIKKLMLNPLALPRIITNDIHRIEFSVADDGRFQINLNGSMVRLNHDDIKIMLANLFMFTLNAEEA